MTLDSIIKLNLDPKNFKISAEVKILKIIIDRKACIGSAACVAMAGKTFDLDGEGKAIVVNPEGDTETSIQAAADGCPTQAITIVEENGEE